MAKPEDISRSLTNG